MVALVGLARPIVFGQGLSFGGCKAEANCSGMPVYRRVAPNDAFETVTTALLRSLLAGPRKEIIQKPQMSTRGRSSDDFVDEFVRYLNSGIGPKFPWDIPEELRTSEAEYGMFHWQIRCALSNPWVADLLQQLPGVLPRPFRSLIALSLLRR